MSSETREERRRYDQCFEPSCARNSRDPLAALCGKCEDDAKQERSRYALKTIIDERVLGKGVFHQISHQHYAEVLLQAVDDYLEALAALEAK